MAWIAITEPMKYDEAVAYAEQYELACVSFKQRSFRVGDGNVSPIVSREKTEEFWYHYLEDGSYKLSSAKRDWSTYVVYFFVPSKVRYIELITYLYKHWRPNFEGKLDVMLLYLTEDKERFIYSSRFGVIHSQLTAPFTNPLLYFESGAWASNHYGKLIEFRRNAKGQEHYGSQKNQKDNFLDGLPDVIPQEED